MVEIEVIWWTFFIHREQDLYCITCFFDIVKAYILQHSVFIIIIIF